MDKVLLKPKRECFAYKIKSHTCDALTSGTCDNCKFYKQRRTDINRNEKLRSQYRGEKSNE